jgi:hypothetical protein
MARRYPDAPAEYDPAWAQDLIRALNQEDVTSRQPKGTGYSITAGYTILRTLDPQTASAQNVADFLGTLAQDLLDVGFLKE